ncbi:MAG: GMC family oxidoreductase [Planctomycetes bacterium]|nr:GMC family oxidoreductase [Planctomycetota bacterium]
MAGYDCDICIIGSGFGGSVCALRSAEAGLRVVLLERGPRISIADYEDMAAGQRALVRRPGEPNGIAEVHALCGLGALTASAVGGGSHLYTAVTVPAPPEVFTKGWCHLTRGFLDPYYARAQNIIAPSITPVLLERTAALEKAGGQMGGSPVRLPVAIDWPLEKAEMAHAPSFAGLRREMAAWLQGGHCCRKRTLDRTYLALAELKGADVRPLHEVMAIAPSGDGYEVAFQSTREGRPRTASLRAQRVIIAAGTLGTLKLLFRCRDQVGSLPRVSRALGERFFMNGDMGALIFGIRDGPAPDSGPPVTGWIDLWQGDRMFLMELATWPTGLELSTLSRAGPRVVLRRDGLRRSPVENCAVAVRKAHASAGQFR